MRIISLLFFSFTLLLQGQATAADDKYFQILNTYHALKLHLDKTPETGKMKAASWLRLRNQTGKATKTIPALLNPGLRISKVTKNNKPLHFTQQVTGIKDWPTLELNTVSIDLPTALKKQEIVEITLYFEGSLLPLTSSGMEYVKEYLSSEFTILRTENFSLPVITEPKQSSLGAAARLQNYSTRITLELPEGYIPAGNLNIQATKLLEGRVEYDLKSNGKIPFTVIPIAPYHQFKNTSATLNHFKGQATAASSLHKQSEKTLALLENWFMAPHGKSQLTITAIPEGYGSQRMPGLIIQDSAAFSEENYNELYHELAHIWHPKERVSKPSRWNEGLATFLEGVISKHFDAEYNLPNYKEDLFQRAKKRLLNIPDHAATPLQNYGEEDITDLAYLTGAVYFAVLHDSLGQERFLDLIKELQITYASTGILNEDFADFMKKNLKNRNLRKFAKNWFSKGTIGTDLTKANSFTELMSLYKQSSFQK
ncbi:hypothetical protein KFE96_17395 [Kordiimonas sp. SCSIO 12603]|uniref:hypothetical protein n=1 Tax=Kordiimonas sp. SCSIO 12603 TaxID=2829596 RepID=UPI002102F7D2|nr:hypothetical protein [Kordiimonas sp. SCSIO 12603]UTW58571.1 hypothetical protein KFE96_17395 [Kordiimonas sp. SCSIO 12603]